MTRLRFTVPLCLLAASYDAPGAGLSLAELERLALAKNPAIAAASAGVRAAQGIARQSSAYPNPVLGYYGDEIRGGLIGGGKQGGFVTQTVVTAGKLGAARRVADLRTSEAGASGDVERQRVLNEVRSAFYQVLAAQRMLQVRLDMAKVAKDSVQTAGELRNIGQLDAPDFLAAEIEEQQARIGIAVAERELAARWRVLAAAVGDPALPNTTVDGDLEALPPLNLRDQVEAALRDSPAVKMSALAVERAEASLRSARLVPVPDLQIRAGLWDNLQPLEGGRGQIGVQAGAEVGVQLPIFNRNKGGIAAAQAEAEMARAELARVKLHVERDLASLFGEYESSLLTAEAYKSEMLPRAEKAFQLYQTSYRAMAGAYAPVLMAQRTLFQLQADYVRALEGAWRGAVALRGLGIQ